MSVEGMYFDELSKIRVLQPEVLSETEELKDECKQFVDSKWTFKHNAYRCIREMLMDSIPIVIYSSI